MSPDRSQLCCSTAIQVCLTPHTHTTWSHVCVVLFIYTSLSPSQFPLLLHESINACYIIFQSINFRVTRFAYNKRQGCSQMGRTSASDLTIELASKSYGMISYTHTNTRTHSNSHTTHQTEHIQQQAVIEHKCLIK